MSSAKSQEKFDRNQALEEAVSTDIDARGGADVLIVGASPNRIAAELRDREWKVTMIDCRQEKLDRVPSLHGPGIEVFLVTPGSELVDFSASSFDAIIFYDVLHHFPDKQNMFTEANRVLRAGASSLSTSQTSQRGGCEPSTSSGIERSQYRSDRRSGCYAISR